MLRLYNLSDAEYGLRNAASGWLKVSRIEDLNDPFEMLSANLRDKRLRHSFHSAKKQVHAEHGVVCLTETWQNPVMWSHYAKEHQGVCIEYDFASLPRGHQKRIMLYPVIYGTERFDATRYLRPIGEDFNSLLSVLACLHKAEHWRYEREWRLLAPMGDQEDGGFNTWMPTPSRIYLGARMTSEHESELREIAGAKGIPVSRMKLALHSYELEAE